MAINMAPTPNPNAMKFTCGVPVGGPATHVADSAPEEAWVGELLGLPGVTSVFMTADFVTVSKSSGGDWDVIGPEAVRILSETFPG